MLINNVFSFEQQALVTDLRLFPFIYFNLHVLSCLFWHQSERIATEIHTIFFRINKGKVNYNEKVRRAVMITVYVVVVVLLLIVPQYTSMVMLGWSVNLATLFLGKLRPPYLTG